MVDPKRIKVAEQANLHLAPRPGTDVVLAFALAAELERHLGEVFPPLRITDSVARGVLLSHKGGWMRTTTNGQTVSALTPTTQAPCRKAPATTLPAWR